MLLGDEVLGAIATPVILAAQDNVPSSRGESAAAGKRWPTIALRALEGVAVVLRGRPSSLGAAMGYGSDAPDVRVIIV